MEPIKPPKTIRVFQLIKQTGLNFSYSSGGSSLGLGFYSTLQEAEHNRTLETLKDVSTGQKPRFHVFELEFPNPIYEE
jgi:hypothetical protein